MASHQADDVPFAPGCTRIEFGIKTGFSGDQLRRDLNRAPQYKVIKEITEPQFSVNGDEVRAQFELVTKPRLAGRRVAARIDETFLIPVADGKIHHIHARVRPFIKR
nr:MULTISPECIES: hypothetical protein [unclassified Mycolicibacterium]